MEFVNLVCEVHLLSVSDFEVDESQTQSMVPVWQWSASSTRERKHEECEE